VIAPEETDPEILADIQQFPEEAPSSLRPVRPERQRWHRGSL
jgi:hypothetical protein